MNFATKLIVTAITIGTTIVGSIVAGLEWNDRRMDEKDAKVKQEIVQIMDERKNTRDAEILGIKDNVKSEIDGVKSQLVSMDQKLNILIGLGRKSRVMMDNEQINYVTNEVSDEIKRSDSSI